MPDDIRRHITGVTDCDRLHVLEERDEELHLRCCQGLLGGHVFDVVLWSQVNRQSLHG